MAIIVNKVKTGTFDQLVTGAGVIMSAFDPTDPETSIADDANLLYAVDDGGFNAKCVPTPLDNAEGIANAPLGMKEYEKIDNWEVTVTGTAVALDTATAVRHLGHADIVTEGAVTKAVPRTTTNLNDYKDVYIVVQKTNRVIAYCHIMNAKNQTGFEMQTANKDKSTFPFEYKGYFSESAQDTVPFEYGEITITEG